MYCPECGSQISENALFCMHCGAEIAKFRQTKTAVINERGVRGQASGNAPGATVAFDAAQTENAAGYEAPEFVADRAYESSGKQDALKSLEVTQPGAYAADASPEGGNGGNAKNPKRAVILGVIVAAIVIAAVIAGGYMWYQSVQDAKAHEPVSVPVEVKLDMYSSGSGVPVNVAGSDLDEQQVAQVVVVQPNGSSVQLKRGEYVLTVGGYAVSDDGNLYKPDKTQVKISIDADGVHYAQGSSVVFECKRVNAEDITDKQLKNAQKWQTEQGVSQDAIDARIDAAKNAREVRQKQIEAQRIAEEKERKAKEEAEAKKKAEKAKAAAIAANPSSLSSVGSNVSLTGTVRSIYESHEDSGWGYDHIWYVLQLPQAVSVQGTPLEKIQVAYEANFLSSEDYEERELTIPEWERYVGKTVTVSGKLTELGATAHNYGPFGLTDAKVVKSY